MGSPLLRESIRLVSSFHPNSPGALDRTRGAIAVASPAAIGSVAVGRSRLHRLPHFDDPRGSIVVNQAPDNLPFIPTRLFQVFDVPPGELRGDHAHRRCHQLVMALTGSVLVIAEDVHGRYRVELDAPDLALHIPPLTWAIQLEFSPEARILVLASEPYDRAEYLDDYEEFSAACRAGTLA
jgi:hypothetical protein